MTHSRLVCGRCNAPVAEGRCSSCRTSREGMYAAADTAAVWLLALALVLLAVLSVTARAGV